MCTFFYTKQENDSISNLFWKIKVGLVKNQNYGILTLKKKVSLQGDFNKGGYLI